MDADNKQDLFDIKLDETGIAYIKKMFRISAASFIFMILSALSTIFASIQWIRAAYKMQTHDISGILLLRVVPTITIPLDILSAIGVYYFIKFIRRLHHCVNTNDQAGFNQAFNYGYRNMMIFLFLTVTSLMLDILRIIMTP